MIVVFLRIDRLCEALRSRLRFRVRRRFPRGQSLPRDAGGRESVVIGGMIDMEYRMRRRLRF